MTLISSRLSLIIFLLHLGSFLEAFVRSETINEGETCDLPVAVTLYPNGGGNAENVTITREELKKRGKFYNELGLPVNLSLVANGTSLYNAPTVKGTHFVWPDTLEIGKRIVLDLKSPNGIPIEIEALSHRPRVFYVHNFMTEEETSALVEYATSEENPYKMAPSTGGTHISWEKGGRGNTLRTRTSMNAFDISSATSAAIKRRAFRLLRIPEYKEAMADGIQVLRYETGQAYVAHHDYFPTQQSEDFNWDPYTGGSNRFATVFLYLSDVEEGGQTCFPKAEKLRESDYPNLAERFLGKDNDLSEAELSKLLKDANIKEHSWEAKLTRDCYSKFSVQPKKGDAVLFYSQKPDGHLDPDSLHGAGPVLKGTKWGANVWVWNACRYSLCGDGLHPAKENDFEY